MWPLNHTFLNILTPFKKTKWSKFHVESIYDVKIAKICGIYREKLTFCMVKKIFSHFIHEKYDFLTLNTPKFSYFDPKNGFSVKF